MNLYNKKLKPKNNALLLYLAILLFYVKGRKLNVLCLILIGVIINH